jgi:hypothetical protein
MRTRSNTEAKENLQENIRSAAKKGNFDALEEMLKANPKLAKKHINLLESPFLDAAKAGLLNNVEILINMNPRLAKKYPTSLELASANGHNTIVGLLLKAGADASHNEYSSVKLASQNGHTDVLLTLNNNTNILPMFADVFRGINLASNPLYEIMKASVKYNDTDLASSLTINYPKKYVYNTHAYINFYLLMAVHGKKLEVVEEIVKAKPALPKHISKNPASEARELFYAAKESDNDIVVALLKSNSYPAAAIKDVAASNNLTEEVYASLHNYWSKQHPESHKNTIEKFNQKFLQVSTGIFYKDGDIQRKIGQYVTDIDSRIQKTKDYSQLCLQNVQRNPVEEVRSLYEMVSLRHNPVKSLMLVSKDSPLAMSLIFCAFPEHTNFAKRIMEGRKSNALNTPGACNGRIGPNYVARIADETKFHNPTRS